MTFHCTQKAKERISYVFAVLQKSKQNELLARKKTTKNRIIQYTRRTTFDFNLLFSIIKYEDCFTESILECNKYCGIVIEKGLGEREWE